MTVWLLKGFGAFGCKARGVGQADPLPGQGQQLGPRRRGEALRQEEEVAKADEAVAVQVEAGIAAAEGLGEQEEVGEAHLPVGIEVGRDLRDDGKGHRLHSFDGRLDGVGPRVVGQGHCSGGEAPVIGGVRGDGQDLLAGHHREGDRHALEDPLSGPVGPSSPPPSAETALQGRVQHCRTTV